MNKKIAIIAGAGPAGLTAAIELLRKCPDIHPIIVEATPYIGGISRTANHNGNRIDIGGHRFFSKNQRVTQWWNELMPVQEEQVPDNKIGRDGKNIMLRRRRVSRIYYLRRFFDYPISLSMSTLRNMGLMRTLRSGFGYLWSMMNKRPENSLENFYINRFGKPLYSMFFEDYTEKVWGVHPSKLGADWGSQRVKGLSITAILKDMMSRSLGLNRKKVETSLIEEFIYPPHGPGQLWELAASTAVSHGAELMMETAVTSVITKDGRVVAAEVTDKDGNVKTIGCDYFISSMPLKDLVPAVKGDTAAPPEALKVASGLPYRDFITVGLLVDKLKINNQTKLDTYNNRVPDTWIYIQERDVKVGRLQIFNNWSPAMVADWENTVWIGMEYFCNEGDDLWTMTDADFINLAKNELEHIGIIDQSSVIDAVRLKVKKAYPSYFGSFYNLGTVRQWLDSIPNLFCVGRNGQHRYNNMDHSMLTAMEAVDAIAAGDLSKENVWNVNTEEEYHESK